MRALLCLGMFGPFGPTGIVACFKPALPQGDVELVSPGGDVEQGSDTADAAAEVGVDAIAACTANAQCAHLDGPCTRGLCSAQGLCEASVLSDVACDDGDACTRDDICDGGVCRGDAFVCDDGLACTTNVCDGRGGCSFPVAEGRCLIEGACLDAGTPHPTQACRVCEGGRAWSPADGGSCDDGDACTLGETCRAGVCTGGAPPDDAAGDFLRVFAHAVQPIHTVELAGLVARESGGTFATLRVQGTVQLGNGQQYATPSLAHLIVALDAAGEVVAAWAVDGGWEPRLLGEDLTGRVMWSSECHPCTIKRLGAQTSVQPETSEDKPAVLVRAAYDGALETTALSHAPEAKDALDRTYLRLMAFEEPLVVRGAGAASTTLTIYGAGFRAAIWLVRFSHQLVPEELNGIQYKAAGDPTWPHLDMDAGPLHIATDGRIVFPFVTGPAELRPRQPNLPTEVTTNSLMLAIHQRHVSGLESMSFIRIVGQLDNPLGFFKLGHADARFSGENLVAAGRFAGQSVVFGDGTGTRAYQSSQLWGLEGSGNFGAGLEGFVVSMKANEVEWLRTLRPLGHPVPWEIAGSGVSQMASSSSGWVAVAGLGGLGAWMGEASPKPITAPSTESLYHQVYAEYSQDGRLLWTASADGTFARVVESAGQLFLAGQLVPGTNGVGPSRIDGPELEVPTPRVYIQRFNSAGALSCGVVP